MDNNRRQFCENLRITVKFIETYRPNYKSPDLSRAKAIISVPDEDIKVSNLEIYKATKILMSVTEEILGGPKQ